MSLLIKNTAAITLDENGTVLESTDIAIKDKNIFAIGKIPENFHPSRTINAEGYVALPSFFNSHTHSAMTLVRGWAEDLPFDRWLNEKIWVAESAMEEEDVYWGTALACCEMIRSGTAGFSDHYFWMNQAAKAVEESGMKAALSWCQFGIGKGHEIGGKTLEDTISFIKNYHNSADSRIKCFLGPHSPYMCPPEFLSKIARIAKNLNIGIHIHLSESEEQVKNSVKKHKKTPVEHLNSFGVFDNPCIAAHCISVNEKDIEILSDKKVNITHTPKTYMKLGMGMAAIEKFINAGINVSLGTDGPASNNDLNMLEVMRLTGLIHKNRLLDPASFPSETILRMATQNSAIAMGFEKSGKLKEGSSADLILFNTQNSHWMPRHDLKANIVYSSHPSDIEYVICAGKLLLDKSILTTLDEEKIKCETEKRAFKMTGKEMRKVRSYSG